jgi:hypothetical protein
VRVYLVSVVVLIALPVAAVLLTLTALGFHVGDLWGDLASLRQQENRSTELSAKIQRLRLRLEAESAIIDDLCAQRTTLAEAMSRMCELRSEMEMALVTDQLRWLYPDATSNEEILCRYLICVVANRLIANPEREAVVTGLEVEMSSYLCK